MDMGGPSPFNGPGRGLARGARPLRLRTRATVSVTPDFQAENQMEPETGHEDARNGTR